MRSYRDEVIQAQPVTVTRTEYTCDSCGNQIPHDAYGITDQAHILEIALNKDQCVSYERIREYCNYCVDKIWVAVNKIVNGDPGKIGIDRDYDYWAG